MSSGGDGGSRVSIPADLRKTIQTIREITGKQHTDEDIFTVLNDCFNDPYETAQKLHYLDTFHEVRSKRDKKKENLIPNFQGNGRSGRRNYTYSDSGNGRNGSFKRESGVNHIKGGFRPSYTSPNKSRNITQSRAIKTSNGPTSLQNEVVDHKSQDDFTTTGNCKSTYDVEDGVVETNKPLASTENAVQNHTEDLYENRAEISKPVVDKMQSSSLNKEDTSNCNGKIVQVSKSDDAGAGDKRKTQLILESDVDERPHVTFPVHIQVVKALENGLTFGSFGCNSMKETSSNNDSTESDLPNVESSHGTEEISNESSPTTSDEIPEGAPSSVDLSTFVQDKDNGSPNSGQRVELVVSPVEESKGDDTKENLPIQNGQQNVFNLMPSFSSSGQPVNVGAINPQYAISKPQTISYSTPTDQSSIAASQQAIHLFRQQYPPNFFPYGPYFPPYYMPHPYIHQFLNPNGLPQQSYLPPGAAPGIKIPFPQYKLENTTGNPPPLAVPSPYGSSTVAFNHIPAATAVNPIHKENFSMSQSKDNVYPTGNSSENAAAWMVGQSLSNLQVSPMYNLALQGQPLAFPPIQAGHGGLMRIYQPVQPMATVPNTDQTLQPSRTTPAMVETVGPPPITYQQPQVAQPNWTSNY